MIASRLQLLNLLIASASIALGASLNAQCPSALSCLVVHSPGGCDNLSCCTLVCTLDPTCCINSWDSSCVNLANESCAGYCGAAASGSCYGSHANPSCDTAACCSAVCAIDPYCCTVTWDITCVQYAGFACAGTPGTCGQTAGSCFTPHQQGACSNTACCEAVCSVDPSCCQQSWDILCVYAAEQVCVPGCVPVAESTAVTEVEGCDERVNDPCYITTTGTAQVLTPNLQLVGTLGRPPSSLNGVDVDVYRITIADPDGDGSAKVAINFASSPPAWAALLPAAGCAPISSSLSHIASNLCVDAATTPTCIPAGEYRVVVSGGTYPTFGGGNLACNDGNQYTLKITVAQACNACSPTAPSCFSPHQSGGCNLISCCTAVCGADPFCCDGAWDAGCAAAAANTCVTVAPANDTCVNAIEMTLGSEKLVNTAHSSLEIAQPIICGSGVFARDVWYFHTARTTGTLELSTCGSWFNTVLAVYTGTCASPTLVNCNDDSTQCSGTGASRVSFPVQCGERYLFRVGPKAGKTINQGGEVILRLTDVQSVSCLQCSADFNHTGVVDAQDLAVLLNGWGTASTDLTGDGNTNAQDLAFVLNAWGPCP